MNLNKLDAANVDEVFLDTSKLVEGLKYERVALVVSADAGLTKSNDGFARFFLKDVNANIVCARLFNVQDFIFSGAKLSQFKNKPVKLRFMTQVFNGKLSLVIDGSYGIKGYDGDFDRARFVGRYSYDEQVVLRYAEQSGLSDWHFPRLYGVASFVELGNGKVAAFAKVMELCVAKLMPMNNLEGVDGKVLGQVFFVVMECYFRLLKAKEQYGFISDIKTFDIVGSINTMDYDKELRAIVLDCVKPLAGLGTHKHLYSHLINNAINDSRRVLELVQANNQLIVGASTKVEGGVLLSKF